MANRIVLNTVSYHGKGRDREYCPRTDGTRLSKGFCVLGPGPHSIQCNQKVTDLLDAAGFAYEVYSDIKPNPYY